MTKKRNEAEQGELSSSLAPVEALTENLHDVEQLNHAVSGSNLEVMQLKPGTLNAKLSSVSIDEFSIDHGAVNQTLRVRGSLDPQRFGIGLFPRGSRATWNGHHIDPAELLFYLPGSELNGWTSSSYGWTSLVVPLDWVKSVPMTARQATALEIGAGCRMLRPEPVKLRDLREAAAQVALIGDRPAISPRTATWLLMDMRNALGAALSTLDKDPDRMMHSVAHFSLARRAEHYMRERMSEPVCVTELCRSLHVGRRYLEYAFNDAFGTSPSRYLRLLRLQEVRNRLKTAVEKTSVTDEALRLGFIHLGQFSIQYKRAFGESPSTTLARSLWPMAAGGLTLPAYPHAEIR